MFIKKKITSKSYRGKDVHWRSPGMYYNMVKSKVEVATPLHF